MTGEKDKLLSISKSKTGNVIPENDESGKIKDRGMMSLSNDKGDAQYVLLLDGLKHNSLCSSQKCDKGSEEVLMSKECKVNINSGQVVNKSIKKINDVEIESSPASKEEDSNTIEECSVSIYPMEEVKEELSKEKQKFDWGLYEYHYDHNYLEYSYLHDYTKEFI